MIAKLTSSTNALRLFAVGAVLIIFAYIAIFLAPNDNGSLGIYLPVATIIRLYMIAWLLLVVAIVVYTIRRRSLFKTGQILGAAALLALPLVLTVSAPNILRQHRDTLSANNHVYQLSEDILPYCPDTFDPSTYRCYKRMFFYQCESLGLFCNLESHDILISQDSVAQLHAEGDKIQVVDSQNTVAYTYPS